MNMEHMEVMFASVRRIQEIQDLYNSEVGFVVISILRER